MVRIGPSGKSAKASISINFSLVVFSRVLLANYVVLRIRCCSLEQLLGFCWFSL
jgi:hypothetical protein